MTRFQAAFLLSGAWAALLLAGCSPAPPPPPMLDLTITGSADQNPNPSGVPTPVAVHLYQLASAQKFARADVFALLEHEQATLGADLLGSDEVVIAPSEQKQIKQQAKMGTQVLGIVVLYADIDHAQWRASAPVAASGPTRLVLSVQRLSAVLKPAGP